MQTINEMLRDDPEAVFEISLELPGGKLVQGTAGPIINGVAVVSVRFQSPPSEVEMKLVCEALDHVMGGKAALTVEAHTDEDVAKAHAKIRQYVGGGLG